MGMSLVLAPLLLLAAVAALVGLGLRARRRDATPPEQRAGRHLGLVWRGALALGLVSALVSMSVTAGLGRGFVLAPSVAGVVALLLVVVGERTLPTATEPTREAAVVPRAPGRALPRHLVVAVGIVLAALLALLTAATALGRADDMGRHGRGISWDRVVDGEVVGSVGGGPWPGSWYSVPLLAAILLLLVLAGLALRAAASRPQVNAQSSQARSDGELRAASARTTLAFLELSLAGSLVVVSGAMAMCTHWRPAGTPGWVTALLVASLAGLALGLAAVVHGFVALAAAMPRRETTPLAVGTAPGAR